MTHSRSHSIRALVALAVVAIAGLAACTSAGASTAPSVSVAPPSTAATAEPSMSEAPSAAASEPADLSAAPSAVATSIDPCQLVTPAEVATVTGVEWGSDSASPTTLDNNGKACEYGQEGIQFDVIVVQAPDAATAKAEEPAFKAQLEQTATTAGIANMRLTELPNFLPGVDAAIIDGSTALDGTEVGGTALYALKGPVLLAMTELTQGGQVSPSSASPSAGNTAIEAAMEAEAKIALGRIP
jgi:hypothetical protein